MDTNSSKKVTIDQVAEKCGVSKTTISRYLNHKYENISEETRSRIARIIDELGYRPNRTAQRLKASRSMLIGCSIGDVSSPFSGLLLKGITETCEAAGYQVLFADCADDPQKERLAIEGFQENRVDGLIVNSCGENDDFLVSIDSGGIPIVLADRSLQRTGLLDTVISEYDESVHKSVKLLLDYGYSKVAFFTEKIRSVMPRIQRRDSYIRAMLEYGNGYQQPFVFEFDRTDPDVCRRQLRTFRNRFPQERIAVLAVNGVTAVNLLRAMKEENITAGYDFGMCTFDDWSWFQLVPPGITAIRQETEQLGARAAERLLDRIGGEGTQNYAPCDIQLPTTLCIRGSTVKEPGL